MKLSIALLVLTAALAESKRLHGPKQTKPCPAMACINPCWENGQPICGDEEMCLTKPTWLNKHCRGCDVFRECKPMDLPPGQGIDVGEPHPDECPVYACIVPCEDEFGQRRCGEGEVCVTDPNSFINPDTGVECFGCPTFVGCEPAPSTTDCPVNACIIPCEDEFGQPRCGAWEVCVTDPNSFIDPDTGVECFGCPTFVGCEAPQPPSPPKDCPVYKCKSPCDEDGVPLCSGLDETCVTVETSVEVNGIICPGCPDFSHCE